MSIENTVELEMLVTSLMGAIGDKVDPGGAEQAMSMALGELGWTLPINDQKKEYWIIQRTKRYILEILLVEAAWKFQYKKIYLQHRFAQLFKLIQKLDEDFIKGMEENPTLFNIDSGSMFDYITSGFNYSKFGYDTTYGDDYLHGDTYLS